MDSDIKSLEQQNLAELYQFANIGRLSAGLFHDLATPLNIVLLNLEELKDKCCSIEDNKILELQLSISRAFEGTQRMIRFLELAREHVQRRTVLSEFCLHCEIQQVASLFDKNYQSIRINVDINNQKEIKYFGNATQFFQVVMNLISNAIGAYPDDCKIKRIQVSLIEAEDDFVISVQDWGLGISKENEGKIFEPLFTTKAEGKGNGIGLFISREIIEKQFRGRLTFNSSKDEGTTFTIHLPRRASLRALV